MFASLVIHSLLLTFALQFGGYCGCEDKPEVTVLAVVNGVKITKQELGSTTQAKISLLQSEVTTARAAEVERQITHLLLKNEARKRGLTPEQLLQIEIKAKVTEPTAAEVEEFYKERDQRMPGSLKAVKAEIISYLKGERERVAAVKFFQRLREDNDVAVYVASPTPPANQAELERVLATVNGTNITSRDIEQSLLPLIFTVQKKVYAVRKEALDLKINDVLLEQEAKRLNTTPDSVLAGALAGKLPIITDHQAKVFYDENKKKINEDFSKVKFQIIQLLTQLEQQKLAQTFAAELREKAAVQIYLTPPDPPNLNKPLPLP
jgi:hypothetical protein